MSQQMQYSQSEQDSSFNMTGHPASNGMVPESPESFIDGLGRSADINAAFGPFASLAALGQLTSNHGSFGDYRALAGNGHGQQVLPQDPGGSATLTLEHFMHDDAQPWNPLRANGVSRSVGLKPRQSGGYPLSIDYPSFTGFRSPAVPSECDDSGYYGSSGSIARQSVVDASVYGGDPDGGTETQSFIGPFSDLQLQNHHGRSPEAGPTSGKHRQTANPEATLNCPICRNTVKTKAELNKHRLRHEKPFVCKVPGCTRKEGFGTTNDLDRHEKSVHNGTGLKYRCHEGSCKTKVKDWPRADNFKCHLKRVHGIRLGPEADLSSYEYKPPRAEDLAGLGSSEAQMPAPSSQLSPSPWVGLDRAQENRGLPSGEIGLNQLDHVMGLPDSRELVGEPSRSSVVTSERAMHRVRQSLDNSRLQLGMDPMLSGLRDHSRDVDAVQPTPTNGLYSPNTYKPDVVSPADLGSPMDPGSISSSQAGVRMGDYGRFNHNQDANFDRVKPGLPDRPEVFMEGAAHDSPAEHSTHEGSEAISRTDDDAEEDGADHAFHDSQDLFPSLNPNMKTPNSSGNADKPATSELPPIKALLGNASMDESEASALVQSLMEKGVLEKILGKFGYQKAKGEDEKADENPTISAAAVGKEGRDVSCPDPGCNKSFKRHCELKKHMKRHAKPYACTHADCDKRFGSKNDWKRHENSQHIQLEFWRCSERVKDRPDRPDRNSTCGKICHRRETFKHHLEKDHGIVDQKSLEKRCTDCRNGRNFESRFWCGFCQRTIEFEKNGGPAWSERFDHIDAHFTGKKGPKRDISEWKSIESEPLETFQTILPDARSAKSSSPSGSEDGDVNARKRRADHDDVSSAKRIRISGNYKSIRESLLWLCCGCDNMYTHAMTTRCMDANCAHGCCASCKLVLRDD